MEQRRVVITGIGAITSLGPDFDEMWRSLLAGVSGISGIEGFDASALTCRIAGEIRDFTGVSAPYEPPVKPEIELPTGQLTVEECVSRVIDFLAALEK